MQAICSSLITMDKNCISVLFVVFNILITHKLSMLLYVNIYAHNIVCVKYLYMTIFILNT